MGSADLGSAANKEETGTVMNKVEETFELRQKMQRVKRAALDKAASP